MAEYYSIVYMYRIFFIHSSVDGHLGCFHVLAVGNSVAVNRGVHVPFRSFVQMLRNGIAGSYSSFQFSFFEEPPYYFV